MCNLYQGEIYKTYCENQKCYSQVSNFGNLRKIYKKSGKIVRQKKHYMKGYPFAIVCHFGNRQEKIQVAKLVAKYFLPKAPDGYVLRHKNGIKADCQFNNLTYVSRNQLSKEKGHMGKAKPVVKVDKDGNPIEFYGSCTECARKNFLSKSVLTDRLKGRTRDYRNADGSYFVYDNESFYGDESEEFNEICDE